MTFTLAPDLEVIVRPGVLWLDGATVVEREPAAGRSARAGGGGGTR